MEAQLEQLEHEKSLPSGTDGEKMRLPETQEKLSEARRGRDEDQDDGERVRKLARLDELANKEK